MVCCIGNSFGKKLLLWNCWSPVRFLAQHLLVLQRFEVNAGISFKTCSLCCSPAIRWQLLQRMVFLPRDSFSPYATTGLVVPTPLIVVLLGKLDETTPHPLSVCGHSWGGGLLPGWEGERGFGNFWRQPRCWRDCGSVSKQVVICPTERAAVETRMVSYGCIFR